jgi:heme/copper-type cytochrome/quinol oxidase subunit 2
MSNENQEGKITEVIEPVVVDNRKKEIFEVLSFKDWMITILVTSIPVVNLIMFFIWGFSKEENPNKANWAKANLAWMAIGIILTIVFFGAIASFIIAALR